MIRKPLPEDRGLMFEEMEDFSMLTAEWISEWTRKENIIKTAITKQFLLVSKPLQQEQNVSMAKLSRPLNHYCMR